MKGELLNKLYEADMPSDEALAIVSSDVWPKIHSKYCSCGECLAWRGAELPESDDDWLYAEQEKANPTNK